MTNSSGFGRKPNEPLGFSTSRVFGKLKKGECASDVIASSDLRLLGGCVVCKFSRLKGRPCISRCSFSELFLLVCGDMFFDLLYLLVLLSVHFDFSYCEVRGGLLWTWWWTPKKNSCLTDPIRCPRDLFTTVCIHWASTSTCLYDEFLLKIWWLLTFVTRNGYGVLDQ
jgi:hypothetical protein